MKIGIVGYKGYVGKAMVNFFQDHYEVIGQEAGDQNQKQINECELGVVCVPTPMSEDGSCNISIVEEVIEWLDTPVIWIRSTVPPGTCAYLSEKYDKRIVFSPEYIGEGKYWQPYKFNLDEKEMPFFILGGRPEDTRYILDIIVPITGPTKHYLQMRWMEAELVKYMENCYFATKVIFANEMSNICKAFGADYWMVREGWALDPRVDPMHTACFANDPGFGGKCLPKDLNAIISAAHDAGYDADFLLEVWRSNKRFRNE